MTKRFGDVTAVRDLSFSVHEGEVFGVLGHNGAGKTTTVRLLNGLLLPDAGESRVLDLDPAREGAPLRRYTGVLTETPALDERLTGRENLSIFADLFGVPPGECAQRVTELLATFGLQTRADDPAGSYSNGMKQRLALARALLHDPRILFLDEPTAGLDPVAARGVHELIEQFARVGRAVLMCTHNLDEAQRLCDRVAVLEHGRLLALGTPAELAARGIALRLALEVSAEQVDAAHIKLLARHSLVATNEAPETLIVTGVTRDRVPAIIQALVDAGIRLYRAAPQEASLEDVYFALHEQLEER
ncbi:MAG: ABC transporter ATP-binding protein [Caldilineaceae bacterium]